MHPRKSPLFILFSLVALACAGCTPLTFSNESPLDFNIYTSVYVAPIEGTDWSFGGDEDDHLNDYLVEEMTDHSGFSLITTNPNQESSVYLYVTVQVVEEEKTTDDGTEYEYEATATYEAYNIDNGLIDSGSEDYTASDRDVAVQDAIDEVVTHYLPPYRI